MGSKVISAHAPPTAPVNGQATGGQVALLKMSKLIIIAANKALETPNLYGVLMRASAI